MDISQFDRTSLIGRNFSYTPIPHPPPKSIIRFVSKHTQKSSSGTAESEPTGNEDRSELPTKVEHTDNISSEVGEMACTESNALENKTSLASESEVAPQEFPPILIMPSVETTGHLQVDEAGDVEQVKSQNES